MEENNTGAYLRMYKNPVIKPRTKEDYKEYARRCLNQADAFFEISNRCKDMFASKNSNAFLTNVSFSCELYLKFLLISHNNKVYYEHNLYELFRKLPTSIQLDIKRRHPKSNIKEEDFLIDLEDIGQSFTIFRYMYERGNMAFNAAFLLELLTTLYVYVGEFKNTK